MSADGFSLPEIETRLARFLSAQGLDAPAIEGLRRFTVGFSWVTFGFEARWREAGRPTSRRMILRLGPPNGIFGPYRASPEFVTLRALQGNGVPVPGVHWHSDASDDFGAPFIIADFVDGEAPIPWTPDGGPAFDEPTRLSLGAQFLDALAALHGFDWRAAGLATVGGPTGVDETARDRIDMWRGLLAQWSETQVPMLEWAALWLRDHAPPAPQVSIVHGDYRIGNFLVDDGRISAILDWELVRLGDPVEDLGWICMQAWRGRSPFMCHLFERGELLNRYNALTGFDASERNLRFWEAFGTYKLAVMHFGARHCFERRGFNDMRMAGMGAQIPRMLLQVETAMERARVSFDLNRLFEGIVEALRAEVIPNVSDPYARGQAIGVTDLISNIAGRVEWARPPLIFSVQEKRRLLAVAAAALEETAPAELEPAEGLDTGPLIAELARLDAEICEAMRRAHERPNDPGAQEALRLLIRHAHDEAAAAMKWTRRPQFGEMASGKAARGAP